MVKILFSKKNADHAIDLVGMLVGAIGRGGGAQYTYFPLLQIFEWTNRQRQNQHLSELVALVQPSNRTIPECRDNFEIKRTCQSRARSVPATDLVGRCCSF